MSKRDTQFAGFAKQVVEELLNVEGVYIDCIYDTGHGEWEQIIARRAYDLVEHAIYRSGLMEHDWRITTEAVFNAIPDMTEWPKEQEEGAK